MIRIAKVSILAVSGMCNLSFVACDSILGSGQVASVDSLWASMTAVVSSPGDTLHLGLTLEIEGKLYRRPPTIAHPWPPPGDWAQKVVWHSTADSVASVDDTGIVTSRGLGTASVILRVGELEDSAVLAVRDSPWANAPSYRAVGAGDSHSCALTTEGRIHCWGDSWYGQLGVGTARRYTRTLSPVTVRTAVQFDTLAVGATHTCALADGEAYCWGSNEYGQLGTGVAGPGVRSPEPSRVADGQRFSSISAGNFQTCATTPAGEIFCWGGGRSARPTRVETSIHFVSITVGGSHVCGLTDTDRIYCWGDNGFGQLGDGTNRSAARPTSVSSSLRFDAVDAGDLHTCALALDEHAYCWGNNWSGRLGNGSDTAANRPTAVDGQIRFSQISSGGEHTCAVSTEQRVFCWGSNWRGQLGIEVDFDDPGLSAGDLSAPTPVPIASDAEFVAVSASGERHSCALAANGALMCWGVDGGQLGDGRITRFGDTELRVNPTPVRVAAPVK